MRDPENRRCEIVRAEPTRATLNERRSCAMQAAPEGQSEAERNKAVVRRFIEEVQNEKKMDVFDELNAV